MEAKELRLGNYVLLNGEVEKITSINSLGVEISQGWHGELDYLALFDGTDGTISPIPLTEEWLKKFGFEGFENEIRLSISINTSDELCWVRFGSYYELRYQTKGTGFTRYYNTKYVHQLQNLYFALTDKELAI